MPVPIIPHSKNAPGDFYVECDSCIACTAPYLEASDLMNGPEDDTSCYECYFKRQPVTEEEIERACDAIMVSCTEAVRYSGSDRSILKRLYDRSSYGSVDLLPSGVESEISDFVRKKYRHARKYGVHWSFTCEETSTQAVVACCFGGSRGTLGIFTLDKTSHTVDVVEDDTAFRPTSDHFRRMKNGFWWWQRAF